MSTPSNIGRTKHQGRSTKPRKQNKSGLIGALQSGNGKWMSRITIRGKRKYLGYFHSAQEAHDKYVATALQHGIALPN